MTYNITDETVNVNRVQARHAAEVLVRAFWDHAQITRFPGILTDEKSNTLLSVT